MTASALFSVDVTQLLADQEAALAVFAELQQRLTKAGLVLRAPPPVPTTCCGRGCNGCVWEGFYDAANYWRDDALEALETMESLNAEANPLESAPAP